MASTDPKIKDGFPIPQWLKTKPTRDFEPFATSPPAPEDSFFFIKYPKSDIIFGKQNIDQDFQKILKGETNIINTDTYKPKEKDWSKHTKPCQDVLHGIAPVNNAASTSSKTKTTGADDDFKGEGAACGSSVVKVAHQMISKRSSQRGFTVASPEDDDSNPGLNYHMSRRGSKSLPVTPAHSPNSSPTSRRRKNVNRYFTSPFEQTDEPGARSWLTAALMGYKKDLTTSTSTLAEEDAVEARLHGASLAESVENLGPAPRGKEPTPITNDFTQQPKPKPKSGFLPKPSELREMNFWSPTSM